MFRLVLEYQFDFLAYSYVVPSVLVSGLDNSRKKFPSLQFLCNSIYKHRHKQIIGNMTGIKETKPKTPRKTEKEV